MEFIHQTDSKGVLIKGSYQRVSYFDGHPIYPAGSKKKPLPNLGAHETARSTGPSVDADWEVIPDWTGFEYWTAQRTRHVITEAGVEPPANYLTADPGPTPAEIAAQLKHEAQTLLSKSDQTVGRCYESGVPVPEAWKQYRSALRAIVSTGVGTLPNRPEYPAGT